MTLIVLWLKRGSVLKCVYYCIRNCFRLGHYVFELCHLLFSFMFAIMVDDYIDKHKVSSEGGLPGYFL